MNPPYSYRLLLQNKQIGPFDRRTIVGMRIKKVVPKDTPVLRSDGLLMTVAQLVADRDEAADPLTEQLPTLAAVSNFGAVSGPISVLPEFTPSRMWPVFNVGFGGGFRSGSLGFVGSGEVRFQGDLLYISGRRKTGLFSRQHDRVKLLIADIAALDVGRVSKELSVILRSGHPLGAATQSSNLVLTLDSAEAVQELLEMVRSSM